MCGITGFWTRTTSFNEAEARDAIEAMTGRLVHRGPDAAGTWTDEKAGLCLGHRRLSILDLSSAGAQPMASPSGRYVIVYNGEIYNHLELRRDLEASANEVRWNGHSDTETLLVALETWGTTKTLERLVGMFAFAVWDKKHRKLILARDRIGEKPLYYGFVGKTLVFASELKAIKAYPGFDNEIDRNSLALLLRQNFISAPHSIFAGISKLPPGTYLEVADPCHPLPSPNVYWSARSVFESASLDPFRGDCQDAVDQLEQILREAVKGQMLSDVPLGAFLSGGIDSSTIVALMQSQSTRPIKTYCIGFDNERFNEAEHARAIAGHLGTDNTVLQVTARDALNQIPDLPGIFDEPCGTTSQIPTVLLSKLTREHVTVAMSGDGGDEIFGGYQRYRVLERTWSKVRLLPERIRPFVSYVARNFPDLLYDVISFFISKTKTSTNSSNMLDKILSKVDNFGRIENIDEFSAMLTCVWADTDSLVPGSQLPQTLRNSASGWPDLPTAAERSMVVDIQTRLPDAVMFKVDRSTMSASLEARAPLLDHRVVEFAASLPLDMKISGGKGKHILREVLDRYVPNQLIDRPKRGFSIPVDDWLRDDLRDWAEDLLSDHRLKADGYLDPQRIRSSWTDHCSGKRQNGHWLWPVLMFQAWLSEQ